MIVSELVSLISLFRQPVQNGNIKGVIQNGRSIVLSMQVDQSFGQRSQLIQIDRAIIDKSP